ncbi:hypothetical protein A3A46_03890 [Candidatus Roizmanbacteria bacterium RIFCSPLOWO2_01_FULL_37_13]|uniref:Large ribosomal subunit protein uL29 n=1 Tax=Candidatus Roizmanbacteria bacterium RIFCSPHIGHO2_02_FULL_38_11 TaxID=1802039 RepID=A0A1F7H225_9BACT|nr:MAG: hypothetical protein A3C25_03555 [Candidatus Roizmanbacteria bacterium RIFCSPHIGHO2_02_FULL_38_11]OGK35430.1 MAG: hypothetical protein A3F58_02810 [Candidatus Roizmanbacteria bacterium RIFCSPHIGHO2_12_FULL_37_9b]OGK40920.1 MAG: hypothetical protein A3A46_03890 [Candidatus Roizmanbacteria bacterium RIFCSPLOWO2_01_FULL_37_13]
MKNKVSGLKAKSTHELEKEAKNLREEIAKLRLELKVNPPKDINILMKKRKQLAITLTIIGEKKELEKLKR